MTAPIIPAEIIKSKRRGQELSENEIKEFIAGYLNGLVADYQMSAFLMATFFQGMSKKETFALTQAMLHSGVTVDLSDISGVKVDKHSTGGVGDKTSLVIGPMVAAAGIKVPMISGRGLGHTGGTLDKLESIPDFNTQLSLDAFKTQIANLGICFIGQTNDICPADKKMYALRDVTGTVECIPLICASIMSKKLAEGADGIVLDVKTGTGAFMKSLKDSTLLAKGLVEIAKSGKKRVAALITNMNNPLGVAVGNSLEVQECLDILTNKSELNPATQDLRKLCIELATYMIALGAGSGINKKTLAHGRSQAEEALTSGRAFTHFKNMVIAQGGDLNKLPRASMQGSFSAEKSGYISKVDTEKVGLASLSLGAGRLKSEDIIDPSAGLILHKRLGERVNKGEIIATLYYNGSRPTEPAQKLLREAYEIRLQKPKTQRLILKVIT